MAKFSDYLEDALLNHVLRNVALASPASVWLGLHTADPTDAVATARANELFGLAYARQQLSFAAPVAGVAAIDADVTYPAAVGGAWGTLTHLSIWDSDQDIAEHTGTADETFNVQAGVNDALLIAIDGGADQPVTLTAGGARTAAQVANDITVALTGGSSEAAGTKVKIKTTAKGYQSTLEIKAVANDAYTLLGLTVATYRGTNGNFLFHGALTPNVVINENDIFKVLSGNLSVQLQ